MIKILFTAGLVFLAFAGLSQSWSTDLSQTRTITTEHAFHIEKVVDKRPASSSQNITLLPGVVVMEDFYRRAMLDSTGMSGLVLFIRELKVESGSQVYVSIDFYYQDQFVFEYKRNKNFQGLAMEESLADLLKEMILEFDASDVSVILFRQRSIKEELDRVKAAPDREDDNDWNLNGEEESTRDVFAVGYQIGGLTLIGADYEFRVSDVFGVHAGAGLAGFTFGLKLHTGKSKDSPFFNVSIKDGGFGLLRTGALEYGGRIVSKRNKGSLGFHGQVGLAKVLYIDSEFEESVYGPRGIPIVILSAGVGISW